MLVLLFYFPYFFQRCDCHPRIFSVSFSLSTKFKLVDTFLYISISFLFCHQMFAKIMYSRYATDFSASKHVNFLILLRRLWYSEKLNSLRSDNRFIAVHYARKITKICLLFACRKICRISYLHCFRKHPMISVYLFYCVSTMEH